MRADDKGEIVLKTTKILARWKEYVTVLCADDRTQVIFKNERNEKMERISEEEVKRAIEKLPKTKATEVDELPAEFLQSCGEEGITIITAIINKIYKTGEFPKDFLTSIFTPIPKTTKAMKCEEFRKISLI